MPSLNTSKEYLFARREPGLFIEIYFPKRVLYQDEIIKALTEGVKEDLVKDYMTKNATQLLDEFGEYPFVFDPLKYRRDYQPRQQISEEEVKERIAIYNNPFFGWSTYDTAGAFFSKRKKVIVDELTQIVRIIFRFESRHLKSAKKKSCEHIVRSIASWLLMNYYHRMAVLPWSNTERDRFISEHNPLSEAELKYVRNNYANVATETIKWFDDSALFGFGFLVRRFWKRVVEVGYKEDEIWVTSLFNLGINMVKPRA